ncbi:MAG TPA: hypothetical protein VGC78_13800 [Gaiellaceae bacterium]|jgi:hypothetical protein
MTAATTIAPARAAETAPEPGWRREEFELLSDDEVVDVLLRRLRRLVAHGLDPAEALLIAGRVELPVA